MMMMIKRCESASESTACVQRHACLQVRDTQPIYTSIVLYYSIVLPIVQCNACIIAQRSADISSAVCIIAPILNENETARHRLYDRIAHYNAVS